MEQGVVKTGDNVEIKGFKEPLKAVVTGVEMFRKILNRGEAGMIFFFEGWFALFSSFLFLFFSFSSFLYFFFTVPF